MSLVLYTWTTPKGRKTSIMLEELGLRHEVRPIGIGRNQQFGPEYRARRICIFGPDRWREALELQLAERLRQAVT